MALTYRGPQRFGAVQAHSFYDPDDDQEILLEEGDPLLPQALRSVQRLQPPGPNVAPSAGPGRPSSPVAPIKPGMVPQPKPMKADWLSSPMFEDIDTPQRDPRPRYAMAGPSFSDANSAVHDPFDSTSAAPQKQDLGGPRKSPEEQEAADDDVVTAENYSDAANDNAADDAPADAPDDDPSLFEAYTGAGGSIIERVPSSPARWSPDKRAYIGDLDTAEKLQSEMDEIQNDKLRIAHAEDQLKEAELGTRWMANVEEQRILGERKKEAEAKLTARSAWQQDQLKRLDQLDKDVKSKKVDPLKMFRTGNPIGDIVSILATSLIQGAGAYGATLSGSPNYAKDVLNQWMDADIRGQEEDIASQRELADHERSVYARKLFEGGDPEQIKLEIKDIQLGIAEAEARQIAAESENAHMKTELAKVVVGVQEERLKNRQQLTETFGVQFDDTYKQASGGGLRVNPLVKDLADLDGKMATTSKTKADAAKTKIDATKGEREKRVEGYGRALKDIEQLDQAVVNLERVAKQNDDGDDIDGIGLIESWVPLGSVRSKFLDDEQEAEMKEALALSAEAVGRAASGGAITAGEDEKFKQIVGEMESANRESFYRSLTQLKDRVRRAKAAAAAAHGEDAAAEFEARKQRSMER